jgi:carbon storage regulator
MLVLTRKVGEAVAIGGGIVVRVLECGGRVRLGVEAPDEVLVMREEVAARLELAAGKPEPKPAAALA